jgi:hypothetical protein
MECLVPNNSNSCDEYIGIFPCLGSFTVGKVERILRPAIGAYYLLQWLCWCEKIKLNYLYVMKNIAFLLLVFFSTQLYSQTYCIPANTTCGADYISFVNVGGMSRSSTCDSGTNNAYGFYSTYLIQLNAGQTHSMNTGSGSMPSQMQKAWIDYDADGVFESNEVVYSPAMVFQPFSPMIGSFTVPASTPSMITRMRIRARDIASVGDGDNNPCVNYVFGETEDYPVQINNPTGLPLAQQLNGNIFYPNPVSEQIWLTGVSESTIYIVDMMGRIISQYNYQPNLVIDVSHLPSGIYFIQQAEIIQKLIKR